MADILIRLQKRSADYASFKMPGGSERERVYSQHTNPGEPPVMRRPKPTATADVEFAITGAKSRQTNHGSRLCDVLQALSRSLSVIPSDVGTHFPPKSALVYI